MKSAPVWARVRRFDYGVVAAAAAAAAAQFRNGRPVMFLLESHAMHEIQTRQRSLTRLSGTET